MSAPLGGDPPPSMLLHYWKGKPSPSSALTLALALSPALTLALLNNAALLRMQASA